MRADKLFWNNRSFVDPGLCLLSTLIANYYFEVSIDFKRLMMAKRRRKLPTWDFCLTRTSAHLRWLELTSIEAGAQVDASVWLPSASHVSLSRLNYSARRRIELIEMGFLRLACTVHKFILFSILLASPFGQSFRGFYTSEHLTWVLK